MKKININSTGTIKATTAPDFLQKLSALLSKDISFLGNKLGDKQKESFYLELSILLTAGVDIKTSLELISQEQQKLKDKELFNTIKDQVIQGSSLSEAIKLSGYFSAYEYYSMQIGEESGKINMVLKELAGYYKKKIKQRRQIISALTYPAIVLATSVGAIIFMMNFIVPMFADVFKRSGGELPFITATILSISDVIGTYIYWFIFVVIAVVSIVYTKRKTTGFRKFASMIMLKMPLFGPIIHKIYLARFCHSMTLLIGSKVPILRAISMVKQMIGFYPIEVSLAAIEGHILQGEPLHKSLERFPVYPSKMTLLVKVGEEVNQLEFFFDKIAEQYTDEVEYQTAIISSLIEPFIIIFLGLIVGVILIAMYLPLFQLGTAF